MGTVYWSVHTRTPLCGPLSCTQPPAKQFYSFISRQPFSNKTTIIMASRRLFRQLFDKESSTYTYLLADMVARQAILIDPVIEQAERDVGLVRQLGLNLQFVLNTHVHADHITGTGRLKRLLPNTKSVISKASGAKADILVSEGDTVRFGDEEVAVVARLTKPKDEFIALMAGLGLPYPKKIDESLPANMVCGLQDLPERMKDWV